MQNNQLLRKSPIGFKNNSIVGIILLSVELYQLHFFAFVGHFSGVIKLHNLSGEIRQSGRMTTRGFSICSDVLHSYQMAKDSTENVEARAIIDALEQAVNDELAMHSSLVEVPTHFEIKCFLVFFLSSRFTKVASLHESQNQSKMTLRCGYGDAWHSTLA